MYEFTISNVWKLISTTSIKKQLCYITNLLIILFLIMNFHDRIIITMNFCITIPVSKCLSEVPWVSISCWSGSKSLHFSITGARDSEFISNHYWCQYCQCNLVPQRARPQFITITSIRKEQHEPWLSHTELTEWRGGRQWRCLPHSCCLPSPHAQARAHVVLVVLYVELSFCKFQIQLMLQNLLLTRARVRVYCLLQ